MLPGTGMPGLRPGPGGPAKAWAIDIHSVATGPVTVRFRSSRWRRCVTARQKSSAGPVTRLAASAGPQAHWSPSGAISSTRTGATGTARAFSRKVNWNVLTPRCATCRSRADGGRVTPSASAMSCPCAHVSISRAVAELAALMSGPYQGSRCRGSRRRNVTR